MSQKDLFSQNEEKIMQPLEGTFVRSQCSYSTEKLESSTLFDSEEMERNFMGFLSQLEQNTVEDAKTYTTNQLISTKSYKNKNRKRGGMKSPSQFEEVGVSCTEKSPIQNLQSVDLDINITSNSIKEHARSDFIAAQQDNVLSASGEPKNLSKWYGNPHIVLKDNFDTTISALENREDLFKRFEDSSNIFSRDAFSQNACKISSTQKGKNDEELFDNSLFSSEDMERSFREFLLQHSPEKQLERFEKDLRDIKERFQVKCGTEENREGYTRSKHERNVQCFENDISAVNVSIKKSDRNYLEMDQQDNSFYALENTENLLKEPENIFCKDNSSQRNSKVPATQKELSTNDDEELFDNSLFGSEDMERSFREFLSEHKKQTRNTNKSVKNKKDARASMALRSETRKVEMNVSCTKKISQEKICEVAKGSKLHLERPDLYSLLLPPAQKNSNTFKISLNNNNCHPSSMPKNLTRKKQILWLNGQRNVGLWVKCDRCNKHRYLKNSTDPLDLPDKWYCYMNLDLTKNNCSCEEEKIPFSQLRQLIRNKYNAGSVVYVKIKGYPWWPAVVQDNPEYMTYFILRRRSDVPLYYHVHCFWPGKIWTAWVHVSKLKSFKRFCNDEKLNKLKAKDLLHKRQLEFANCQAKEALKLTTLERLNKFAII